MKTIQQELHDHLAMVRVMLDQQVDAIAAFADRLHESVAKGGKVLLCGNGGSAADAQHFAAELVGRFRGERRPVSALSLSTDTSVITAIANDYGYDELFARQVSAHGCSGDALVTISTSGRSLNCIKAVQVARDKGMTTLALTGREGGALGEMVDVCLAVPSSEKARIQEAHALLIHLLCGRIDIHLKAKRA